MERDHTAELVGFQGEQVDGKRVCGGGGASPWQICLNQVWHAHMSENNGIPCVLERVSVSQQARMESDGRPRLRRESGDHGANAVADLQSHGAAAHCHPTWIPPACLATEKAVKQMGHRV